MRKRAAIVAAVVLGGTVLIGAPSASAKVCASNSCSTAIDSWNGVQICDGDADGNAVESNFYRDNGSHQTIKESRGNGNCTGSGSDSGNKVYRHQAHQFRDWAPDLWSSFEYRY
ncbi:hypothetical protein OU787_19200 [Kitasatospora sp. YST-16]|uniref:hypothetical protein n=1 Tax=Kitasatospora sp. YST-16 TaxID=2998080 RepID=UPI002283304D|nr:hypothetical protein [Kitasatospora sp. YST-16]WAL73453.1 hypothetical protein OU787_19200 [Kitasatospora sp. YST-16]WNW39504.1 hypothetical protein RKE32_19145 [Streptomyces sp. Li-HN-5-13]